MSSALDKILANNRAWSANKKRQDADFFHRLSLQQNPDYLWIGCSDSRVPANQIMGLDPGEVFVHRNIANMVVHTDLNCLSVLQFAVDVLQVEHIIVCGHYGCGGIRAATDDQEHGLIDNWLLHVKDVATRHHDLLRAFEDGEQRLDRLCEINVYEQVRNLASTTVLRQAWRRGQSVCIYGLCYGVKDGLLIDLGVRVSSDDDLNTLRPPGAPERNS